MRNLKLLAYSALVAWTLLGCQRTPDLEVRTFNLKHRSGYEAAQLIQPYIYEDREGAPGTMSVLPSAISVRETPDNLEKIGRVLSEFDTPISPIRLRFQLIQADSFKDEDPAIADVVEELHSLFRFEGYRLMGEALVTLDGGEGGPQEFEQRFTGLEESFVVRGEVGIIQPGTARLRGIELYREETGARLLQTSVSVSVGQTVVIGGGKARRGQESYILTVRAIQG
jgi:hypothetical protein